MPSTGQADSILPCATTLLGILKVVLASPLLKCFTFSDVREDGSPLASTLSPLSLPLRPGVAFEEAGRLAGVEKEVCNAAL
ncbi:hypothetical protein BDK51DRAFT_49252 [Blyttiomyces helicus]|uniref:Uncharacterized protein n=1 Tax=Blyttiomyces helicus TaxID=388810 RepID=A0A4P9WNK0_9FUNG|nr:hypothetical protein BDK51DRAFT_49252 [Blyttiomyces helicus]|eukprot:RKO93663.1 hypothetical protein BDK51DRAFT_49252 [Blyttiomyces helicus]